MAKINSGAGSPNSPTLDGLNKFVNLFAADVEQALNGQLTFADNFRAQLITVIFTAANTEKQVLHTIKKVPTGYFNVGAMAATTVYDGVSSWTTSALYLKSSVATTVRLLVF